MDASYAEIVTVLRDYFDGFYAGSRSKACHSGRPAARIRS